MAHQERGVQVDQQKHLLGGQRDSQSSCLGGAEDININSKGHLGPTLNQSVLPQPVAMGSL